MPNFSLSATLGLNSAAFQTGMSQATAATNSMRTSLTGLGGQLAALGLLAAARRAVNLGSKISDLGVQLNIGTTELQVLMRATQEAGVGQQTLSRALRNVQLRTEEAILGNTSYADAFDRLGIEVEAFRDLPTEDKFEAIAIASEEAEDKATAFAAVARILGERAGPELQEVLQTLARDGFEKLATDASEAGQIMENDVVRSMDETADKIEDTNTAFTILIAEILVPIVDILTLVSQGWGLVKDSIVAAIEQAGTVGTLLGDLIGSVLVPLGNQLGALADGFEGLGHAMVGDLDSARDAFNRMKSSMDQGFDDLMNLPANFAQAWEDYNTSTEQTNQEWEDKGVARLDRVEESWDSLFNELGVGSDEAANDVAGIADGAEAAADGSAPSFRELNAAVFAVGEEARLTREEIERLNEIRFGELTSELNGVENEIEGLNGEIRGTQQEILDLNQENLDGLLDTFGVTAEQLGDEMQRQIEGAGRDGADLSSEELERAYQTAIGNIRSEMRRELGDNADFSNVMPDESELRSIAQLMGTVSAQASALAEAPTTVQSLTEELGTMNEELATLEDNRETLQSEIESLDESMTSASDAIADKAQAIEDIEIPETLGELIEGDLGDIDFSDITSEIQTTNDKLDTINTTLEGYFVNQ